MKPLLAPKVLRQLSLIAVLSVMGLCSTASFGAALKVVGQGTAKWGLFTVYDATLYAKERKPATYLAADTPLALKLCYARSVKASDIVKATKKAIPKAPSAALQKELDQLNRSLKDVNKGDCYQLTYESGVTRLDLNQRQLFQSSASGFKQLYFGVWIGADPLSPSLKQDLLK